MNLSERTSDALIGVFVVGAALVLMTALVFTQGWNRRSWQLNVTSASAEGLSKDTKVFLQGLEIGRVASVSPQVGGARSVRFLVELELDQRFANDSLIQLPGNTTAEIADAGFVGGKSIHLLLPTDEAASQALLVDGAVIAGRIRPSPITQIASTAEDVAKQVRGVLDNTQRLLASLDGTVRDVRGQFNAAAPRVQSSVAQVDAALRHLEPLLQSTAQLTSTADTSMGPLRDSMLATMGAARQLLLRLDTLTSVSTQMASENRGDIRTTVAQMKLVGLQLEYFLDQVSRRPLRMLTGVRPLPTDSVRAAEPSDTMAQRAP